MDDAVRPRQIAGDHAGGEAVLGVVGAADDFVLVLVFEQAQHRAEDFFAHDAHVVAAVAEDGRGDEGALGVLALGHPLAATQNARAGGLALGDVVEHLVHVREADQRPEVGRLLLRITQANALHTLQQLGLERCFQARRDEHPGAVGAHLAGAEEVGHDRDIGCAIQIGILADDQRRLATQFHGHVLQRRACRAGHDLLARRYATGERYLGDTWVFGDQRPDTGTTAGKHVEHAIG